MDTNQYSLLWLSIGILLITSEIFTGTFYLLLIGVSAIIVSVINYLFNLGWPTQIILLGLFSAISILLLRHKLVSLNKSSKSHKMDEAEMVIAINTIAPHAEGLVQYQGVPWTAVNQSSEVIEAQQAAIVIQTHGNKLIIKPQSQTQQPHQVKH